MSRVRFLTARQRWLALAAIQLESDSDSDASSSADRPRRLCAVKPYLLDRSEKGEYARIVHEMYNNHPEQFQQYFKMSRETYDIIFSLVCDSITKQVTQFKVPIPPTIRFALTLRILAHGDTFRDVALRYKVGESTARGIFSEVCQSIWDCLFPMVMPVLNQQGWRDVAARYQELWQYPHCLGAVDGKHVRIQCPPNSGSEYHNYKGFFSMVLMAVCDADKRFISIDIGQYGARNDASVFEASAFGNRLRAGELDLPPAEPLYPHGPVVPFVFLGDKAFGIKPNFMRPFPDSVDLPIEHQHYNYRHRRGRLPIENTFGILVKKFSIFDWPITMDPNKVVGATKAAAVLHNLLRSQAIAETPQETLASSNEVDGVNGNPQPSNAASAGGAFGRLAAARGRTTNAAQEVRHKFVEYFNGQGKLPWQDEAVAKRGNRGPRQHHL